MPRGDSTGPMGMGAMTGRGAGFCTGYNMPGYLNNAGGRNPGRGFGRGFGFGGRGGRGGSFGFRNRFFSASVPLTNMDPEVEKQSLKSKADYLQSEMEAIKKRLDELTAKEQGK